MKEVKITQCLSIQQDDETYWLILRDHGNGTEPGNEHTAMLNLESLQLGLARETWLGYAKNVIGGGIQ